MLKKKKIKPNREQNVPTKYCCWRANQHHQEPRKLRMPCPAKYPSQPITHKGNTQCKKMGSGEIGVLHSKPKGLGQRAAIPRETREGSPSLHRHKAGGRRAAARSVTGDNACTQHARLTQTVYQIVTALRHPGAWMCCFVHILMCHLAVDACTAE